MFTPQASLSATVSKKRPISFSGKNVNQVKQELTAQLDDKEKLIEKVGTSQITRNALLKQTEVIKKELRNLDEYEESNELPDDVRSKLEDLANEVQYLKSSKSTSLQDANLSKQTTGFSPLLPPPPTNSSPTKHRTKTPNGNRRNPDIEFATEIGQGLLIEVRKLQAALQEKDEIIKQLELYKGDNERTYESTQRQLKQREEIEERLKEENWNLEVANQELRTQLTETSQLVAKHNADFTRLTKNLKSQSEQIDIMKAQEEKSNSVIEAMKARHEQETFHLRRHAASAQRENTQLQKQMETLNTELKICKAKLAVKLAASSRATEELNAEPAASSNKDSASDTDTNNSTTQQSNASPQSNNRNQAMEAETLKQSLAHAHRIISNLRSSLHKEKMEKFEIKKMLSDSQENIEQLRKEMSSWNTNNAISFGNGNGRANGKKKLVSKKKRGGVARKARGLCPTESDIEQQQQKQSNLSHDEGRAEESSDMEVRKEDEEEGDLYDDSLDDEDDEDESLDEDMMDPHFSFGPFGQTPFSSVPMMPLSSELENKVHVIDVGINTDPVELNSCPLEHVNHTPTAMDQNSNTKLDSLVAQTIPHQDLVGETDSLHHAVIHEAKHQPRDGDSKMVDRELKNTMTRKPEVDLLPSKSVHTEEMDRKDVVTKAEADAMVLAAVASATAVLKHKLDQQKQDSAGKLSEEQVDDLIQKSVSAEIEKAQAALREALTKQKEELETARLNDLESLKSTLEQLKKEEIEKTLAEAKAVHSTDIESIQSKLEESKKEELQKALAEIEAAKLSELEEREKEHKAELERQKQELEDRLKTEVKKQMAEMEAAKLLDFEAREREYKANLDRQKQELDEKLKTEVDQQKMETEKKNEEETLQEALAKQKADLEIARLNDLENLKSKLEQSKKEELEKVLAEMEMVKLAELEGRQKEYRHELERQFNLEAEAKLVKSLEERKKEYKVALERQKQELDEQFAAELEKQKAEMEKKNEEVLQEALIKQKEELEAARLTDLENLRSTHDESKKEELAVILAEREAIRLSELDKREEEHKAALEHQKQLLDEQFKADIEKLKVEMEKEKEENALARKNELEELSNRAGSLKKEYDDLKQRMMTMLTKDSADVLIKRAVADAVENMEKRHAEAMSGMISREYSTRMVKDEVEKALEKERKEVAEREEQFMISKVEAEALAKVAAADAIVKERQAMAAREKELITKEEADLNTRATVKEAIDAQKKEAAAILAKEKKTIREQMVSKEEAEKNTKEAVRVALLEYVKSDALDTPVPTDFKTNNEVVVLNKPSSIERSVSTSRLKPPTVDVCPAPSVSTPASSNHKLRLSNSVSSLRLGGNRNEKHLKKQRQSTDSSTSTFGSLRLLDTTKYTSTRLQSKSSISLRELSKKQNSSTSISTLSSNDEQASVSNRMPMPMSSNESFPGFSGNGSTDMEVISSITQTMIGEWMSKHTRKYVGGGISENKHQRFFWVHPYTRILYWSSARPGAEGSEAKTKSAYIESVTSVRSNDTTGASPKSLLIRTPKRDLKITASSLERHELWLKSLSYLLGRSTNANNHMNEESTTSSFVDNAGQPQQNTLSSRTSNAIIADAIQYDSDDSEDMVNIRQCCDGKHDVSTLSRGHHHHH